MVFVREGIGGRNGSLGDRDTLESKSASMHKKAQLLILMVPPCLPLTKDNTS